MITWDKYEDGAVVLTMNDPAQSTNTWRADFRIAMAQTVARLEEERDSITGVILTSGKSTFHAGADLKELGQMTAHASPAELTALCAELKDIVRRVETLGRPVVSAMNGSALGGGLELALATHHRIAVDDPRIRIGLPEIKLGAIPGLGGIVRTVRLLGLVPALQNVLASGQTYKPVEAVKVGIIDEVVATLDDLVPAARAWIAANPEARQPWDRKGYRLPGGRPTEPTLGPTLPSLPAMIAKQAKGADFPAARNMLAAALEGAEIDYDAAMAVETRYFVNLLGTRETKNMVQSFFNMKKVNNTLSEGEAFRPKKLAMIGAGMMGAGIAYEYAKAGVDVVLKDVSLEAAERGKDYTRKLVAEAVSRGTHTEEWAQQLLARITPTGDLKDLDGADFMIEAVFEDPVLKLETYSNVEPRMAEGALLASNTSQIPISSLAEGVTRPEAFIGMHFSSPVEKMPMVEVIKGRETSEETLKRAVDTVRLIGKTPIVVNDGRGFYLTRLFNSLVFEALEMVAEGVPAPSIEQASAQGGFATQPLLVLDQISLNLARHIVADERHAAESEGRVYEERPSHRVIARMVEDFRRPGRAAGAGFYDYVDGRRVGFWPGLADAFGKDGERPDIAGLIERMRFRVAAEVLRARAEGIVESDTLADVGSVMAGFPATTGGAMTFVRTYPGGEEAFYARARELAAEYGSRFAPADTTPVDPS